MILWGRAPARPPRPYDITLNRLRQFNPGAGGDGGGALFGLGQDFGFVDRQYVVLPHQPATRHHHAFDIVRLHRTDQIGRRIVQRQHIGGVGIDHRQIGLLAHFDCADLILPQHRPRRVVRDHRQNSFGRHGLWIEQTTFVDQRGQPHIIDQRHAVVAGRAIRPDTDANARRQHFGDMREAQHPHGGGGIMRHFHLMIGEHLDFVVGQPNRMHRQQIFAQDAQIMQVGDRGRAAILPRELDFLANFGDVHLNPGLVAICQFLRPHDQRIGVVEDRAQVEPDSHATVGAAMPLIIQGDLRFERLIGAFLPANGQADPGIHR